MKRYAGYQIVDYGCSREIIAPCGCYACDRCIQPGHYVCSSPPDDLLLAEEKGEAVRAYVDGNWKWFLLIPAANKDTGE